VSSIQKEGRNSYQANLVKELPHQMKLVNELKRQVVNVRLCIVATMISLTTCGLDDIHEEVWHYFPDLFFVVSSYLP